jgi:hypothetical protein
LPDIARWKGYGGSVSRIEFSRGIAFLDLLAKVLADWSAKD